MIKRIVWGVVLFGTVFFLCSLQAGLEDRPLNTDDAYTIKKGTWSVSIGSIFLREDNDDKEIDIVGDFAYSPLKNLELGLQVPYAFLDPEDGDTEDGISDITIRPEYQFLEETDVRPAVSSWLAVKTETGDSDKGTGTGTTDISLAGNLSKKIRSAWLHANIGYTFSDELDDAFFYKFAFEYQLTEKFRIVGEVVGSDNPSEWLLGFLYWLPNGLIVDMGLGTGLTDASPDIRVTGGVTYNF